MQEWSSPGIHESANHHGLQTEPVIHEDRLPLHHPLQGVSKTGDPIFLWKGPPFLFKLFRGLKWLLVFSLITLPDLFVEWVFGP